MSLQEGCFVAVVVLTSPTFFFPEVLLFTIYPIFIDLAKY